MTPFIWHVQNGQSTDTESRCGGARGWQNVGTRGSLQGAWDFFGVIKMFCNRLVIVVQLHEYTKYHWIAWFFYFIDFRERAEGRKERRQFVTLLICVLIGWFLDSWPQFKCTTLGHQHNALIKEATRPGLWIAQCKSYIVCELYLRKIRHSNKSRPPTFVFLELNLINPTPEQTLPQSGRT